MRVIKTLSLFFFFFSCFGDVDDPREGEGRGCKKKNPSLCYSFFSQSKIRKRAPQRNVPLSLSVPPSFLSSLDFRAARNTHASLGVHKTESCREKNLFDPDFFFLTPHMFRVFIFFLFWAFLGREEQQPKTRHTRSRSAFLSPPLFLPPARGVLRVHEKKEAKSGSLVAFSFRLQRESPLSREKERIKKRDKNEEERS